MPKQDSTPSDDYNIDALKKDPNGTYLKELLNQFAHHENQIKNEINKGLAKEDFDIKQGLLEAIQQATNFVQVFWKKNNKQ